MGNKCLWMGNNKLLNNSSKQFVHYSLVGKCEEYINYNMKLQNLTTCNILIIERLLVSRPQLYYLIVTMSLPLMLYEVGTEVKQ